MVIKISKKMANNNNLLLAAAAICAAGKDAVVQENAKAHCDCGLVNDCSTDQVTATCLVLLNVS